MCHWYIISSYQRFLKQLRAQVLSFRSELDFEMNNTTACDVYIAKYISGNISSIEELFEIAKCINETVIVTTEPIDLSEYNLAIRLAKAYAITLIVTSLLGVVGNTLVIAAYVMQYQHLNTCRVLNLHLACCDFVFALMQILIAVPSFTGKFGELKWPFGLAFCKISRACLELGSFIGLSTILIIALERYQAILYPLRSVATAKIRAKKGLVIAWILGVGSSVPIILVYRINAKDGVCEGHWSGKQALNKGFNIYVLIVYAACPLAVITFCYIRIIAALKKPQGRDGIYANLPEQELKRRRKAEMRIVKMLILVVIAFFLCVLPKRIVSVILNFIGTRLPTKQAFICAYVGFLPYPFHVAINPFIYSLKDTTFLKNAFCKPKDQPGMFSGKSTEPMTLSNIQLVSIKNNNGNI